MERISWDELFMEITRLYGKRSFCKHFQVGVVFSRKNRILCAGYNGPPKGEVHCIDIDVGCAKEDADGNRLPTGSGLCRGSHAEMNALANANIEHVSLEGAIVHCTYSPCYDCAEVLVHLGIKEFVFEHWYKDSGEDSKAIQLFKRQGINVRQTKRRD
ncbi:cytidine deaminase [Candidatus Azambacteria bacterium]|nr:cytidine deaminase [Candidatus Azambacteria bacterium]